MESVLADKARVLRAKYGESKSYTVKVCLDELSKIEGYKKNGSRSHLLSCQLTNRQTKILESFGMKKDDIRKMIEAYKSA